MQVHSGIVNGSQLLYLVHTVLEPHIGELQLYLYFIHYRPFPIFVFVTLDSSIYFLGASIVCINNLKRTADLIK